MIISVINPKERGYVMANRNLSDKQREILDYLKECILERGYPPAVREICEAVHLKSTSSVHAHLESLEEKGYNPINQIVGYILSGDPTYITSHNDARNLIRQLERDELLEKMVKNYIGLGE